MAKDIKKFFGGNSTDKTTDNKELQQITIVINGKDTVVPPYVAINIEALNNKK